MRVVAAGIRALRPFSRGWFVLCAVALLLTIGLGGGTPNSPIWLAIKFLLLGALLASLLVYARIAALGRADAFVAEPQVRQSSGGREWLLVAPRWEREEEAGGLN